MKQWYLILAGLALVVVAGNFWRPVKWSILTIDSAKVKVQIAGTDRDRQRGLSGREFMPEDEGMLFVFDQPGRYAFWMRAMKFPLDFIWIKDNRVVGVTENVGVGAMNVLPPTEASQVLEVNRGFAARHNLKIGDKVSYEPVSN